MVNAERGRRTTTFLLYSVDTEYPQHKMALGRKTLAVDNNNTHGTAVPRDPGLQTGIYGYDVEKTEEHKGRKMSRVAGTALTDSDEDSVMSVGKQLELESTNSIKYRTCSWQKVSNQSSRGNPQNSAIEDVLRLLCALPVLNHPEENFLMLNYHRPPRSSLRNTFAWQSCHFRIRTRSSVWFPAL